MIKKKQIIKLKKNFHRLSFDRPGDYQVIFKNLSGEFYFDILSSRVNLEIYGLYIGKKNDQFQVKTFQIHQVGQSTSNLLIKGVFFDQAKFFYQGLIRIDKDAQKSHAYQKNQNLILSDKAFVSSEPKLEILANDVFCTHGSTTGQLNKEQIYYLQTRGLSKKQAENLLIKGFIQEIEEKLKGAIS